ncbi:peptidyl-prolyl cis-trans isomerase [Flavobacteriaceae bacterium F08102]|nr:peptidyl-prolyl cis-trans isomerase [Flavobacteriaceae bacterium F08102]
MSCKHTDQDNEVVARVNASVLHKAEILKAMPSQFTKEDSALFFQNYINEWALKQLLLQKARINLATESEEINSLVDKYKQDLLINKYKEAVVKQELDTVVTESDIEDFYVKNKQIFRLNEELVKFRYVSFDNSLNNAKQIKKWFEHENQEEDELIKEHELQLQALHLNDSIWVKFDDVARTTPILTSYDKSEVLRKNKTIEKEDSLRTYIVKIKDVLLRNEIAPMSYAVPTIKQMILHQRKLHLLKKIEETITEDAIKNKEFQIY